MSTNMPILDTSEDGRFRVHLTADLDCESPRDNDTGTWLVELPGNHGLRSDAGCWPYEEIARRYDGNPAKIARHLWLSRGRRAVPFSTECTAAMLLEDDDRMAEANGAGMTPDQRDAYLDGVAAELVDWCNGECFGAIVEQAMALDEEGRLTDWTETDDGALWGLIGLDYAEQQACTLLEDADRAIRAPAGDQEGITVEITETVTYSQRFTLTELAEEYGCAPTRIEVVEALFKDDYERVREDVLNGWDDQTASTWKVRP